MSILGPIATIGSGIMSYFGAKDANKANAAAAERNIQMQEEFAKQGIRWKVNDARKAGIHPLYALGAQTTSFSPVSVGATNEMAGPAAAMASLGQDLSRSVNATRTTSERGHAVAATEIQLEGLKLDNEIKRASLASAIQRLKQNENPPFPGILPEGKLDDTTPLVAGGTKLDLDRRWSDGQTFEDRWGEWGGSLAGLAVLGADLLKHAQKNTRIKPAPFTWLPKIEFGRR